MLYRLGNSIESSLQYLSNQDLETLRSKCIQEMLLPSKPFKGKLDEVAGMLKLADAEYFNRFGIFPENSVGSSVPSQRPRAPGFYASIPPRFLVAWKTSQFINPTQDAYDSVFGFRGPSMGDIGIDWKKSYRCAYLARLTAHPWMNYAGNRSWPFQITVKNNKVTIRKIGDTSHVGTEQATQAGGASF